jgi:hypothetical protein
VLLQNHKFPREYYKKDYIHRTESRLPQHVYHLERSTQPTRADNTTKSGAACNSCAWRHYYSEKLSRKMPWKILRIRRCADSRLTDGSAVVSLTHRPRIAPQKHFFSVSGTYFCWRPNEPQGLARPEGLGQIKKSKMSFQPATFRLVAKYLNQLRYRVLPNKNNN